MSPLIESIRQKPLAKRRKIALVVVGIIGLVLLTVLFFEMKSKFAAEKPATQGPNPLVDFKKTMQDTANSYSK